MDIKKWNTRVFCSNDDFVDNSYSSRRFNFLIYAKDIFYKETARGYEDMTREEFYVYCPRCGHKVDVTKLIPNSLKRSIKKGKVDMGPIFPEFEI